MSLDRIKFTALARPTQESIDYYWFKIREQAENMDLKGLIRSCMILRAIYKKHDIQF